MSQPTQTARLEGDFVVFLIGARVRKWWQVHLWLPVARAMPRMLAELQARPELGLLASQPLGFGTTVQYWKSVEHLMAYAAARDSEHLPAWRSFNQKARRTGSIGIWHETYVIKNGNYENIYHQMPPFGLGRAGSLTPVGTGGGARKRLSGDLSDGDSPQGLMT